MGVLKEFKEFAMRGNVIDLAVGVVIGAAFGKIVTSLVEKVIMPPIGLLIGGIDFSKLGWVLAPARTAPDGTAIPPVVIAYGDFLNTVIQFVIIAFAIFMLVKVINRLTHHKKAEAGPSEEILLLRDIRDSLKQDHIAGG